MQLQELPFELVLQILSNLDYKDVLAFVQCNTALYNYSMQTSFWMDLCRLHGIRYHDPKIGWQALYQSNELAQICPHLSQSLLNTIPDKKQLLWTRLPSKAGNYVLCLHPTCEFFGESDQYHHYHHHYHGYQQDRKHAIALKLSLSHTLELWCNACVKVIGFNGFGTHVRQGLKTEHYFMKRLVHDMITFNPTKDSVLLRFCIQKGRQRLENNLYQVQFRYSSMHIVDKEWHDAWLAFISGKSNEFPGLLTNAKLFLPDGLTLDPTLTLGKNFELVGSLARWYIERVYAIESDRIIAVDDLPNNADYCKMIHKIKLREQVNQATNRRYPLIF